MSGLSDAPPERSDSQIQKNFCGGGLRPPAPPPPPPPPPLPAKDEEKGEKKQKIAKKARKQHSIKARPQHPSRGDRAFPPPPLMARIPGRMPLGGRVLQQIQARIGLTLSDS